jgi:hypothetical protein
MSTRSANAAGTIVSLNGRGSAGKVLSPAFVAKQFKPGQSGNPTGSRGATYGEVVRLASRFSVRAIWRLSELMESDDERVALLASQAILDRAHGKARDYPDQKVDPGANAARAEVRARLIALMDEKAARVHSER